MVEMGNRPPLKRPGQVVSNQSGASSETPVAPKDLSDITYWPGNFVKAITSVSDSDEIRTLAATGLLVFESYLRPGVMSKIRKILREEERCGGGYPKPISSGASSETPRSPKNLSDDAVWVDLIVKEITNASDSDDARIRATKALESFKESLFTLLMSEMRDNLQQASGYARSDLLGLDEVVRMMKKICPTNRHRRWRWRRRKRIVPWMAHWSVIQFWWISLSKKSPVLQIWTMPKFVLLELLNL